MNHFDQDFLPLVSPLNEAGIVLAYLGFHCKHSTPENLKLCPKVILNDRMMIETSSSLLTVVCQAKKMFHRTTAYLYVRLASIAVMSNVLVALDHQLHPDHAFALSIAEFSL